MGEGKWVASHSISPLPFPISNFPLQSLGFSPVLFVTHPS
jgi:hypothetical protein